MNYSNVIKVFEKNYKLVPLEIYADNPYKTLVSTVLSARTKDELTYKISEGLFTKAPDVYALYRLKDIEKLIYPVGFYRVKAKNLRSLAHKIIKSFNGQVPRTKKELLSLPGVGTKTANLVLNRAFHLPAIAVDTHVHRISNILGWVNTKTPEQTEVMLTQILPKKYWSEINRLFVSIGRQYRSKKQINNFLRENNLI